MSGEGIDGRLLEVTLNIHEREVMEIAVRISEKCKAVRTVTFHCPEEPDPADQIQTIEIAESNPWFKVVQEMEAMGEERREVKNPKVAGERMIIILPKAEE